LHTNITKRKYDVNESGGNDTKPHTTARKKSREEMCHNIHDSVKKGSDEEIKIGLMSIS